MSDLRSYKFESAYTRVRYSSFYAIAHLRRGQMGDGKAIEVGDFVKVSSNGEAFWCIVEGFGDEGLLVKVNNYVRMQPFEFGDTIAIQRQDVIRVLPKDSEPTT